MSDKLRCAVIGVGAIGLEHLHSLLCCPRAAAVAIAENHPQRARDASERFKIPRSYVDFRELLEQPDIDAVTIAVPNHLHAAMAIEALKARKHVLLEKPLATNTKDALKVVDTAKKMKRTLMVAQTYRFNRHTQLAKMLIERGDLGEIYHARCFWLRRNGIPRIGSWFTQKQFAGGGCAIALMVSRLSSLMRPSSPTAKIASIISSVLCWTAKSRSCRWKNRSSFGKFLMPFTCPLPAARTCDLRREAHSDFCDALGR